MIVRKRDIRRVTALLVGLGAAGIAIGWLGEEMARRQSGH
jgi:small-conductance mechanosensitive channel